MSGSFSILCPPGMDVKLPISKDSHEKLQMSVFSVRESPWTGLLRLPKLNLDSVAARSVKNV